MKRAPRSLRFALVAVILFVSLSCGLPTAPTQSGGKKQPAQPSATVVAGKETIKPSATAEVQPSSTPKFSLDDVKNAVIKIESQGSFADPEGGTTGYAGYGSGFIIDPSGIAVTNNHVVTGAALLKVWIGGDKQKIYNAKVLGASECSDLAVIKIEGSDFPYLKWFEGTPKVGMQVYAAGFPKGDPEYTLTQGSISKEHADGKSDWASVGSVLEHDAHLVGGNSGGPLVNTDGLVVGVNYAHNAENQYFAIAAAEADKVLNQLKGGSDVTAIGVNGQAFVTDDKKFSGIWVASVKSGSPADKAGLKGGDIILTLEGMTLSTDGTMADYCQILNSHKPTDTLSLSVLRWSTKQIMEGQINGRQLAPKEPVTNDATATASSDNGWTKVYDDSKVVSADAPNSWEYDGRPWEGTWSIGNGTYKFTAQQLIIAADVARYEKEDWAIPGITISTSEDWGRIGGYANLIVGISNLPMYKKCTAVTPTNITLGDFEGMKKVFKNCGGTKASAIVYAVRPIKNPQAYLLLVQEQYSSDNGFDVVEYIMGTITIDH